MTAVPVHLEWTDRPELGAAHYLVAGPRLAGAVTARWRHDPHRWIAEGAVRLDHAALELTSGIAAPATPATDAPLRELTVNGVRVSGRTTVGRRALREGARPHLHPHHHREAGPAPLPLAVYPTDWPQDLPEATGWYTAAVLDAVARHWAGRAGAAAVRAAAVASAPAFTVAVARWWARSAAPDRDALLEHLTADLYALARTPPFEPGPARSTTVHVHPHRP